MRSRGKFRGATVERMVKVFVSHATADQELVEHLCDDILTMGCGLAGDDLFVSSLPEYGVPSGSDLLAYVRSRVTDATLVLAVITHTYPTRPVCVAELGAAWGAGSKLFPVLVPGVDRDRLDGVLKGVALRYLNEESVLDELRDAIDALGVALPPQVTWTRAKGKWLTKVDELAAALPVPETVSLDEYRSLKAKLDETERALADADQAYEILTAKVGALAELKDREDAAEILLDAGEEERFRAEVASARDSLKGFPRIVRQVLRGYAHSGEGSPYPTDDQWQAKDADDAISEGFLTFDDDDGMLRPSPDIVAVEDAMTALDHLARTLSSCSDEFAEWFRETYGASPDLRIGRVYDDLLES